MLTIVERGMMTIEHRHARLNQALSEVGYPLLKILGVNFAYIRDSVVIFLIDRFELSSVSTERL